MHARILAGLAFVLLLPFVASAQSGFAVASVKRNGTGNSGWSIVYTADSLRATNATLAALIQSAYGIWFEDRLVGGPSWVRTARFDVNAKAAQALPNEQLRLMSQRLLKDRFGVSLTRERREHAVYVLRVARVDRRTGPDLRSANGCDPETGGRSPTDPTRPKPQSSSGLAPKYYGWCATISGMAMGLSRQLGADIIDQTGLEGRWDFVLAFTPISPSASSTIAPGQTDLPSIFVAVEEQLGLKLERDARGSVEYFIVAAAHTPTED